MAANSRIPIDWAGRIIPMARSRVKRIVTTGPIAQEEVLSDVLFRLVQFSTRANTTSEDMQRMLHTVVKNAATDWSRREKRRRRFAVVDDLDHAVEHSRCGGFEDCVSVLSEGEQKLLFARYIEKRTDHEIACELGRSRSLITRRIQRAVAKLRRLIGDQVFEGSMDSNQENAE